MCFGGKPKMPAQTPAPVVPLAPAPTPTILPSEFGSAGSESDRRRKVNMLRMGLSSTIKTPLGPKENSPAALAPKEQTGKTTLG